MAATKGSRMSLSSAMANTRTTSAATQNQSCRSTRMTLVPSVRDVAARAVIRRSVIPPVLAGGVIAGHVHKPSPEIGGERKNGQCSRNPHEEHPRGVESEAKGSVGENGGSKQDLHRSIGLAHCQRLDPR